MRRALIATTLMPLAGCDRRSVLRRNLTNLPVAKGLTALPGVVAPGRVWRRRHRAHGAVESSGKGQVSGAWQTASTLCPSGPMTKAA